MEQSVVEDEQRDGIEMHGMGPTPAQLQVSKTLSLRVQQLRPRRKLGELIVVILPRVLGGPASAGKTDRFLADRRSYHCKLL